MNSTASTVVALLRRLAAPLLPKDAVGHRRRRSTGQAVAWISAAEPQPQEERRYHMKESKYCYHRFLLKFEADIYNRGQGLTRVLPKWLVINQFQYFSQCETASRTLGGGALHIPVNGYASLSIPNRCISLRRRFPRARICPGVGIVRLKFPTRHIPTESVLPPFAWAPV